MTKKPVAIIIRDGWGLNPLAKGNAVFEAKTPNIDRYKSRYPWTRLQCCGEAVRFDVAKFLDAPFVVWVFHCRSDPSVVGYIALANHKILIHPLRAFCEDLEGVLS